MNTKNAMLNDVAENLDDADLTLSLDDWADQLTPCAWRALIHEQDPQPETSAPEGKSPTPTNPIPAFPITREAAPEMRALDLANDGHHRDDLSTILQIEAVSNRLERIETLLNSLVEREQVKEFYSVEEFARLVGKAEFTCREWCRLGRIHATKKRSGRGKHFAWVISHDELSRFRKEGLLPLPR